MPGSKSWKRVLCQLFNSSKTRKFIQNHLNDIGIFRPFFYFLQRLKYDHFEQSFHQAEFLFWNAQENIDPLIQIERRGF